MTWITLQSAYLVLAVGYNLVSLGRSKWGDGPLAPTNARAALVVFLVYGAVIISGVMGWNAVYRTGMGLFAVLLVVTGVIPHLRRGPNDSYSSTTAWISAILINIGGVLVTLAGAVFGPGR